MANRVLAGLMIASVMVGAAAAAAATGAPPFELSVKRDRLVGGSRGALVFTAEAVEYRTTSKKDARRWEYEDVKQVQILSPTRVVIRTFEDQGRLRLGADRVFEFSVVQGRVSSDLVAFLLERIRQPVVSALVPERGEARGRVRVKHERQGRGSEGALALYDDALVYASDQVGASRYWRFADLASVLRLDPARLEVVAYEGGGGVTRPFVFQLKAPLPDALYDALWATVNRSPFPRVTPPDTDVVPARVR